jgi:hypothetical protein
MAEMPQRRPLADARRIPDIATLCSVAEHGKGAVSEDGKGAVSAAKPRRRRVEKIRDFPKGRLLRRRQSVAYRNGTEASQFYYAGDQETCETEGAAVAIGPCAEHRSLRRPAHASLRGPSSRAEMKVGRNAGRLSRLVKKYEQYQSIVEATGGEDGRLFELSL